MDVKFTTVRKSNLNTVPVIDGQVIAIQDETGFYYDMNSVRRSVGGIRVVNELSGVGQPQQLVVVTKGSDSGVYIWDEANSSYVLVANTDTDTFLALVKSVDLEKGYLTSTNGEDGSMSLFWADDVYIDYTSGTVTAKKFNGVATKALESDFSSRSTESEHALTAEVSNNLTEQTFGDSTQGIYLQNGKPAVCEHTVKSDVPEDAKFSDTTYTAFLGSTQSTSGSEGLVPQPGILDTSKFLKGDGTWSDVEVQEMYGCTKHERGYSGLVPAPSAGETDYFLSGDGSWSRYLAGKGLQYYNNSFYLASTDVQPGTYGPTPNAQDMTIYQGNFVMIPRITVDETGRVTNIVEVPCYLNAGGDTDPDPIPNSNLMFFSVAEANGHLLCTYVNSDTSAASFSLSSEGDLLCEYTTDPSPYTFALDDNGHLIATRNESVPIIT